MIYLRSLILGNMLYLRWWKKFWFYFIYFFLLVGRKSINSGWVIIDTIKITFVAHYYILHFVFWQIFKFIINLFYAAIWGSWCRMQCRKIDMYAYLYPRTTDAWWQYPQFSTAQNHIPIPKRKSRKMYENLSFLK